MKDKKIAILVDSCCDVPKDLADKYNIFILPLKIIFKANEYLDNIDITPQEVYDRLSVEIPKTSLPSGDQVIAILDRIKGEGYTQVIAVTLSSGLSGTNNMLHVVCENYEGLEIAIFDTLNIAIASGFHAIEAARAIERGLDMHAIIRQLENNIRKSRVFFVVETLEYLQKGGRIGLVASLFGNALNLKPIISCNDAGVYYTVAKVRGRKQSISKTIALAKACCEGHTHYNIAICNGGATVDATALKEALLKEIGEVDILIQNDISPALGVHTGPGTLGIAVQILD